MIRYGHITALGSIIIIMIYGACAKRLHIGNLSLLGDGVLRDSTSIENLNLLGDGVLRDSISIGNLSLLGDGVLKDCTLGI